MAAVSEAPEGGTDFKAAMGKKLGPLPVGVWILAVGGGLMLTYYMRGRGGSEAPPTEEETTAAAAGTGTGSWPYGVPNGVGQWGGNNGGGQEDKGEDKTLPTTNEQWQRRAISILVGRGYEPTVVDRAISAYLGGQSLTTIQRAIINEAILLIGPPPVSPPPPTSPDQPPPVVTPPKPTTPKPNPPTPTLPPYDRGSGGGVGRPVPRPVPRPPTPAPAPSRPAYRERRIVRSGQTLSSLTADYNREFKKQLTWQEVWQFNLRWRSPDTAASLRTRGPNKVFVGSAFWFPV